MIAIVDYGVGNIQALINIYNRLGVPVVAAKSESEIESASHVILPGVGAFDWAMSRLQESGMRDALDELVHAGRKPVLGICVGMQMMALSSEEGRLPGLGWFDARVRRFDKNKLTSRLTLPHMGWNDVESERTDGLLRDLGSDTRFYFLHSYYFSLNNATDLLATTVYSERFASAVQRGKLYGTQFHPEKSHHWGVKLLKNFVELC